MEHLPLDLRQILAKNITAKEMWKSLTPIAQRDFVSWIESATQPETRKRRVESIPSRLLSGKRRPCCYAIVPMNLYKALADRPKAKATWSNLTPDERRDFVDWINTSEKSARSEKVDRACVRLASGKRSPK